MRNITQHIRRKIVAERRLELTPSGELYELASQLLHRAAAANNMAYPGGKIRVRVFKWGPWRETYTVVVAGRYVAARSWRGLAKKIVMRAWKRTAGRQIEKRWK